MSHVAKSTLYIIFHLDTTPKSRQTQSKCCHQILESQGQTHTKKCHPTELGCLHLTSDLAHQKMAFQQQMVVHAFGSSVTHKGDLD